MHGQLIHYITFKRNVDPPMVRGQSGKLAGVILEARIDGHELGRILEIEDGAFFWQVKPDERAVEVLMDFGLDGKPDHGKAMTEFDATMDFIGSLMVSIGESATDAAA